MDKDKEKNKARALVLMSGGLDSILAAKVLEELGVEVTLICFESYFFSCGAPKKAAKSIGMPLRAEDISLPHLEIVRRPRYGHGAGMNPCIDCHLLMLKTAKGIMEAEGFDFVATGEVLGERPMSQNRLSLDIVEKEAGLTGYLLRPLSAKLLPETIVENKGLVDRQKLYDISGRSRTVQYELAKHFNMNEIPQPGGGCLLTEPEYGRRLKVLAAAKPDFDGSDARLLQNCRPLWEGKLLIAVARDKNECAELSGLIRSGDLVLEPVNFPGPVAVARDFGSNYNKEEAGILAKKYLLQYSKKVPANPEISIKDVV
jgi:tRNA-uridine 2-sulfurtransferase